ncbi:MAG TPA: Nramp family divalent metal transporter, partial [Thermomicrobiaceae bacterium]|nr:Nramp family divalent metal transporter [Thermomicrobiaceae bacterium]
LPPPTSAVGDGIPHFEIRDTRPAIWLNLRGRRIQLTGLKKRPRGLLAFFAIFGPGLIAGAAGNDAGGIATYSQIGAQFGYEMLWVLVLITVALALIQEMAARLGAATGRGLIELIRLRYGVSWSLLATAIVFVGNTGLVITEFVGIGAAARLLGITPYLVVPLAGLLVWYLVVAGNYPQVEKIFLAMALVFLTYPVAAFLAHPHWGQVARGTFVPTFQSNSTFLLLMVGIIGTTITPYQQLFQQSSVVEKGVARRHYGPERADVYLGSIFNDLMSAFMIIATAAALHFAGKTNISTAADAAQALRPVAGNAAKILFAVGLLGASLLAAAVLPLTTAYAVSEVVGLPRGINVNFRTGRLFMSVFTGLVIAGIIIALLPGVPVIKLLVLVQVLNGILLPIMLTFILLLVNDKGLMNGLRNTRRYTIAGWVCNGLITASIVVLLGQQLLSAVGFHL